MANRCGKCVWRAVYGGHLCDYASRTGQLRRERIEKCTHFLEGRPAVRPREIGRAFAQLMQKRKEMGLA